MVLGNERLGKTQKSLIKYCTGKFLFARVMSTAHVRVAFQDSSRNEFKFETNIEDVMFLLVEKNLLSFVYYELFEIIVTSWCDQSDKIKDLLRLQTIDGS